MGLALILLSLIPPAKEEGADFSETVILQPQTFSVSNSFFLSQPFDPQHGLCLNAQANISIRICLLDISKDYFEEWISNYSIENQQPLLTFNASALEAFLHSHQGLVVKQEDMADREVEFQYVPTKIANITLVLSNSNDQNANVNYHVELLRFIIPNERSFNGAKFAIPIGSILVCPWLSSKWKQKRNA